LNTDWRKIIEQLRTELRNPLPGKEIHRRMLPPDRLQETFPENGDSRQGAVLLLLFPQDQKLNLVFIRRPSSMKYHAGQIAFPGGGTEPEDADLQETAIREATEEIGIDGTQVEILGELSPLYVIVSNFTVHAFVGWAPFIPSFQINPGEVDALFIIPIENLIQRSSIQFQEVDTQYGKKEFPGYFVNDIFIWGATGMILTEFIEVYRKCILMC
jgi:8-oxo-dGTP pyrophosphatase MutT (NUDIX family)